MSTLFVYFCFAIMVLGNCCLYGNENIPLYYDHYLSILPVLFFCLFYNNSILSAWIKNGYFLRPHPIYLCRLFFSVIQVILV